MHWVSQPGTSRQEMVRITEQVSRERFSIEDVRNLLLDTPDGRKVPLGELADVKTVATPNQILRENGSRRIDVGANVAPGKALGDVAAEVQRRLATVDFPVGYHPQLLGEYQEAQAAQNRLLLFAGVALVGILFLLTTAFNSWRLAFLVLLTLPMALVGGVLTSTLLNLFVTPSLYLRFGGRGRPAARNQGVPGPRRPLSWRRRAVVRSG
jgi:Cu/Ag efflux pump CusA